MSKHNVIRTPVDVPGGYGIAKLSDDVLTEVFMWLAELYYHSTQVLYEWTYVTRVCKFWRKVALACPYLWKYVTCLSIDNLDRILARAKGIPLVARFYVSSSGWDRKVMEKLCELAPRMCELELVAEYDSYFEPIANMDWSKSRLEKLTVRAVERYKAVKRIQITGALVENRHPTLHYLALDRGVIAFTSPVYAGLTELVLSHLSEADMPTLLELQSLSEQSPQLKFLTLNEAGPKPSKSHQELPIVFLALQELHFRGRLDAANALFHVLDIPATSKWTTTLLTNFEYTFRSIDDALKLCPSPIPADEIVSRTLDIAMKEDALVLASKARVRTEKHLVTHTLELVSPCARQSNVFLAHVPYAIVGAGWTDVRALELTLAHEEAADSARGAGWLALLGALPDLAALRVRTVEVSQRHAAPAFALSALLRVLARCDPQAVCAADPYYFPTDMRKVLDDFAMETDVDTDKVAENANEGPGATLVCPKLGNLELETREDFQSNGPIPGLALWEPLLAAVRDRHAAGARLHRLHFVSPSKLCGDAVGQLREFVDDVVTV